MLNEMRKKRWIANVTIVLFFFSYGVRAEQIIVDGRTDTTVTVNGNVSDVTTTTISGNNAYNSFSRFNVEQNNVVNLHLPGATDNLLNLVHDEASNIDGILNAIKNGQIGGNVFFANPHGFVIGANGVVNVGALSLSTPTSDFMDEFFTAPGQVSQSHSNDLLSYSMPLNDSGLVSIQGKVNAINGVEIRAHQFEASGTVQTGSVFSASAPTFADVVNLADVSNGGAISTENGEVRIIATDSLQQSGTIASKGADIELKAKDITLDGGAVVTAVGDAGSEGNVNVLAQHTLPEGDDTHASASVTVGNATLEGADVAVSAHASNVKDSDNTIVDAVLGALSLIDLNAFEAGGVQGGTVEASATATVNINAGANLVASNDLTLASTADSAADISVIEVAGVLLPAGVGIAYADSDTRAETTVASGATLDAGGTIDADATASNTVEATSLGLDDGSVVLSIAEVGTHSVTRLDAGATVTAANIDLDAKSTSDIQNSAGGVTLIGSNAGGIAATYLRSDANAAMNADANLSGDLNVTALSETTRNSTDARAQIKPTIQSDKVTKVRQLFGSTTKGTKVPGGPAAAFAISDSQHTANASVGTGADIDATNVTIDADSVDRFKQIGRADAEARDFALGSAATIADHENNATAYVGANAEVDAQDQLTVDAKTSVPSPVQPEVLYFWRADGFFDGLTNFLSTFGDPFGSISEAFLTTFSITTSTTDEGTGIAGMHSNVNMANQADAFIDNGAQINQNGAGALSTQTVRVKADNTIDSINVSGGFTSGNVLGGAVNVMDYDVIVRARIADGAQVDAEADVLVDADSTANLINIAVAGGNAESFGLVGSVNNIDLDNNVQAIVDDQAVVAANNDIHVTADDTVNNISISGGVTKSKNVGIGFSWAVNKIKSVVKAFFGDDADATVPGVGPAGSMVAGNEADIEATSTQNQESWSLAGAGGSPGSGASKSTSKGSAGFGASGDVSSNTLSGETVAYVDDGVSIDARDLDVRATGAMQLNSRSGSASIQTGSGSSGIAGSYSDNNVDMAVRAFIDDATIVEQVDQSFADVTVEAISNGGISSIAIGGGGSGKVNIAGSVAVNEIGSDDPDAIDTEAYISSTSIERANVTVNAEDNRNIDSITGAVSVGGTAGIGPSVSINNTSNDTRAHISDTVISITERIDATASNENRIRSLAASAGVGTNTFGGAGSLTHNTIENSSEAHMTRSTVAASTGDVSVTGSDRSTIESLAGGGAFGSSLGVAISAAYNAIANRVRSVFDDTDVTTDGSVIANADSAGTIKTLSVGIGASSSAGVAGSVSVNKVQNDTAAEIKGASSIDADDDVLVAATNLNNMTVIAGTGSGGGTAGGGGAVVVNIVDNETLAAIADSSVLANANGAGTEVFSGDVDPSNSDEDETTLKKGVLVDAYSRENIVSSNVNGSVGGTAGVAASTSVSTIKNNTTASITNAAINQLAAGATDDASAEQSVWVAAYERLDFGGGSGNGAGGGTAGVGIGADATVVGNTTQAYIDGGSTVDAKDRIDVEAAHRENVLSASVGLGIGGSAGVAGSGNGARLASTTRAYVADATLNSGGAIGVRASETAELVQIAGNIAGGGSVGGAGSVGVGIIENTTEAYIGNGATTNALGTTEVSADASETVDHFVISGSGGGAVGIAASVSVKKNESTTRAFIDGGATVNPTTNAPTQDVKVAATSRVNMLGASGGAAGSGAVGAGAALDLDFVKNTTTAYIGDGAAVDAGGTVDVSANATKDIESFAVGGTATGTLGVSAMVSVINVGSKLDDEGKAQVGNAGSFADDQVSGDTTQGVDANDSFASAAAQEAAADNAQTSVSDDVTDTSTESQNRTSAFIGDNATVAAGTDLNVDSSDRTEIAQNVGGISVGLGGAVGGAVGIVNSNTFNQAIVGSGAEVSSGGTTSVTANSDSDVDSTALAGAGGLIGLGASVAIVNDQTITLAELEDGVIVDRATALDVAAASDVDIDTFAFGATAGAGAVGASIARSNSDSVTRAIVADGVMIGQNPSETVGALSIVATSDTDSDARAIAGTAGIISGSGADARSNIVSDTHAGLGQDSLIQTTGDVDIDARALTQGEARADGVNVAGLTVGVSIARADATPTVSAGIGPRSQIVSNGDIDVRAAHNVDALGNELTSRKMHARAFSAAGALVGGVGSDARASIAPDVDTTLAEGVSLDASGTAEITANNVARSEADASGQAFGVAAGGVTRSDAVVDAHTDVTTAMDVLIEAYDITIAALTNLFADSDTTGGNGGLLSVGGTSAKARIDNSTRANIGQNNTLAATNALTVEAVTQLDANSNASVGAGGAVTINQVSADTDLVNDTAVDIGTGATLTADDVTVQALVTKLKGYAKAKSTTFAAGSDSEARSYVDIESSVETRIAADAELRGQNSVQVTARTTGIDLDSIADAKIGGGFTGNLLAVAHGDLDVDSDLYIETDAIIAAPNIDLLAETVSNDGDFNRDADAEANTVVNWVLQRSTQLVRKAEKIPFIGWFFKWVRKTVLKWVAEVVQSDVSARVEGGDPRTDNSLQMNGTLAQLSALSPQLTVNADGSIDSDGNINATVINDEVIVNGVNNNVVGAIDIASPGGVVAGTGTLLLNKTFDNVTITNNSDMDIRINTIDVLAANAADPDLSIDADLDLTTFTVVSEVEVSDVNVTGTTGADIIIDGGIFNPSGVTNLANAGGDIYGNGTIESNKVSITTGTGDIGRADSLLTLNLVKDFEDAELTLLSGGSAYLDVQLQEYLDVVEDGYVIDGLKFLELTAANDMVLNLRSGIVYDLPGDPSLDPVPVALVGNYAASDIVAGGDLSLTEEEMAHLTYSRIAASSVEATLGNGDAQITRIEANDIAINASGAIRGDDGADAHLAGSNVTLNAGAGIGAPGTHLRVDQTVGGAISASADGDVYLQNDGGSLGLGFIDAVGYFVSLIANGNIVSEADDGAINVQAERLSASAAGTFGSSNQAVVVDSGDTATARVNVDAGGDLYLEERDGNLKSDALTSDTGTLSVLVADGSADLTEASAPVQVAISAGNGHLMIDQLVTGEADLAATTQIGVAQAAIADRLSASAPLVDLGRVDHSAPAPSTLVVDVDGDLTSGTIESSTGSLALTATGTADIDELTAANRIDASASELNVDALAANVGNLAAATAINVNTSVIGERMDATAPMVTLGQVDHASNLPNALGVSVTGDLDSTRIESATGDLDLDVSGTATLGTLAAAGTVSATAGTGMSLADANAQSVDLAVSAEGGSLTVANVDAALAASFKADYVQVDQITDSDQNGIGLAVTGNDGGLAEQVNLRVDSMGDVIFDVFKSVFSSLYVFSDYIRFDDLIVGELFDLENDVLKLQLDYKDNKDNENSENLETRNQSVILTVEGTKVDADNSENLFVIKEKL